MSLSAWLFGGGGERAAAPDPPVTHGVSVHCGWASPRPEHGKVPGVQSPNRWPWRILRTRDRVPALGAYDERDPRVTKRRLEWMREGGIDYACYQVEWRHDTRQLLMSHCADHHAATSPVKFCLSWWDVLSTSADSYLPGYSAAKIVRSWRAYGRAVAAYMKRPNYLRMNGRPVLFHGGPQNLRAYARYGLDPGSMLTMVVDEVRAVTGGTPYMVATAVPPEVTLKLRSWGFDAFTEYLFYSSNWPGVVNIYRQRWNEALAVCRQIGIDYWVPATAGYDSTAWGSPVPVRFLPTPAQFTAHLKEARAFAQRNARYTRGQVITYAWNEFGEGGIIEPMQKGMIRSGDEMLRAHRAAIPAT